MVDVPLSPGVDLKDISFLGEGPDPQLLLDIHVAEQSYRNTINCINSRNALLKDLFSRSDTIVSKLDRVSGEMTFKGDLRLIHSVESSNQLVFDWGKKANSRLADVIDRMARYIQMQFPRRKTLWARLIDSGRSERTDYLPVVGSPGQFQEKTTE